MFVAQSVKDTFQALAMEVARACRSFQKFFHSKTKDYKTTRCLLRKSMCECLQTVGVLHEANMERCWRALQAGKPREKAGHGDLIESVISRPSLVSACSSSGSAAASGISLPERLCVCGTSMDALASSTTQTHAHRNRFTTKLLYSDNRQRREKKKRAPSSLLVRTHTLK